VPGRPYLRDHTVSAGDGDSLAALDGIQQIIPTFQVATDI
jgi:hypothetical protein